MFKSPDVYSNSLKSSARVPWHSGIDGKSAPIEGNVDPGISLREEDWSTYRETSVLQ